MILVAAVTFLPLTPYAEPYVEKTKPNTAWKAGSGAVQMAFSADASTVATVDPTTGTVATWDAKTGNLRATLGTDKGGGYPEVSADGKFVATQGKDGKLRVWTSMASPKALATLELSPESADYRFAASGHRLTWTTSKGLSTFDPGTTKTIASAPYRFPERFILQAGAGVVIADTSDKDSGFYVWDGVAGHKVVHAPLGRQVTDFVGPTTDHTLIYQGIAFSPESGLSALLYEYDLKTRKSKEIFSLRTGRALLTFRYFEPKGRQVCLQHYPGQPSAVRVRLPGSGVHSYLEAAKDNRLDLRVDAAGKAFATVGDDGTVRVWQF